MWDTGAADRCCAAGENIRNTDLRRVADIPCRLQQAGKFAARFMLGCILPVMERSTKKGAKAPCVSG